MDRTTARDRQIATCPSPSMRQTTRLLMTDDNTLSDVEQSFVSRLLQQVPPLADCVAAARRLKEVLRRKSQKTLNHVLDDAAGTALGSFVASLRRDLGTVQAALKLPWTTSPAEGQINRLKILNERCMAAPASTCSELEYCTLHSPMAARNMRENPIFMDTARSGPTAHCQPLRWWLSLHRTTTLILVTSCPRNPSSREPTTPRR
jgi:hypothetical protein